MIPTEERCSSCEHFQIWSKGCGAYPACSHPDAGTRVLTLLSEMDSCPKDK